jgi:hypothetical protein
MEYSVEKYQEEEIVNERTSRETILLSKEENSALHGAFIKSLQLINEFLDAPRAARLNMGPEMRVANNVLTTFRGIKQSESGQEMVVVQRARMICEDREEMRKYLDENLPHLSMNKALKA